LPVTTEDPTKASAAAEPSYEARLEAVLESVSDGFYAVDADWKLVVFNRAAELYFGVTRDRVLGRSLQDLNPPNRESQFWPALEAAMAGVPSTFETASLMRRDTIVEVKVSPLRGGGAAVTLNDVTERRRTEVRQRLLVNELNHRVKNALATVQAIAAQSLLGDDVSPAARERFMERLMALARANDVLVAEDWQGAALAAIAAEVAGPHGAAERFTVQGPPAHLIPTAATAMALALHELATNAAKYGALSRPEGRVALAWTLSGEPGERRLELSWRETGGPPTRPPTRIGFGTRLITRGLTGGLKAQVKLDYRPEGLVFTLSAPVGETITED
jgi:PAS domain S-box-containing protein